MATKLWAKDSASRNYLENVEKFTVGRDREFDAQLAEFDITGTQAHVKMLNRIGFLSNDENEKIQQALDKMLGLTKNKQLTIEDGVEDIHSQIEINLTRELGETGKKIHTGRSRNDQVLLAIKLYLRSEIKEITGLVQDFFSTLMALAEKYQKVLMPGYTHYQIGMPSSFGLWFSAFAESLSEDLEMLATAFSSVSKNPLGSGAGYGSSFPLDRDFTTEELGLKAMNINSIYAQMTRGKSEKTVAVALAFIAATLGKLANDICLFTNQNFGFVSFTAELTTGSSIMPHKKNPDVFELIRAKCSRIQAVPNELTLLTHNLLTGYNRDYQLTKEIIFPAVNELKDCLGIFDFALKQIEINTDILQDKKYEYLFTVEQINDLMLDGLSFRDAYRQVGNSVENGTYSYRKEELDHTHKGSIGNLALDEIKSRFNEIYSSINS